MRPLLVTLLLTFAASLPAGAAVGGTPVTLTHTGYLLTGQDVPLTASTTLTFRVWTAATDGVLEWQGACPSVPIAAGYYGVVLGSSACPGSTAGGLDPTLSTADVPPGALRWLEVDLGGVTLAPRVMLASAPTATLAETATLALDALAVQGRHPGTGPNDLVTLDASGHLPAVDGSALTGVNAALLSGRTAGTSANALVALDAQARLPAVDGSLLTNVAAATVGPSTAAAVHAAAVAVAAATNTATGATLAKRDASGGLMVTTLVTGALQVTGGTPAAGRVLTSDASGNASWAAPSASGLPNCADGQSIVRSGGSWICWGGTGMTASGGNSVVQVGQRWVHTFTTNGNFVMGPVGGLVEVELVGGGGGGGTGSGDWGSGGGGGGYVKATFNAAAGQTYAVVAGAGGAGQTSCNNSLTGGAGGSSSFNGTIVANGGAPGGQAGEAGSGGSFSGAGAVSMLAFGNGQAGNGATGDYNGFGGTNGGGSPFGAGATGVPNGTPGNHASGNGNGGSGGPSCQGGHRGGGNGSPGVVLVRYP